MAVIILVLGNDDEVRLAWEVIDRRDRGGCGVLCVSEVFIEDCT